jgi:hypothetical protein
MKTSFRCIWFLVAVLGAQRCIAGPADGSFLFVGNSVLYEYDVPALFEDLASNRDSSKPYVDFIALPGATIAGHVRNGEAARLLIEHEYSYVFLQEAGGVLLCMSDPPSERSADCRQSLEAHRELVSRAHARRAKAVIIGTFQPVPAVQDALSKGEADLARDVGADGYVDLGHVQSRLMQHDPEELWFAKDGMHPGPRSSALMAVLIYHETFGVWPTAPASLDVCRYEMSSGEPLRRVEPSECSTVSLLDIVAQVMRSLKDETPKNPK